MFREMRRAAQALPLEECEDILRRRTEGVLAVSGDDGYPYAVPLNYVYAEGKLIFHCAKVGHKIDAMKSSDKVSFCVVDAADVVPEEYTTAYRSVIVFGRVCILTEPDDIVPYLHAIGAKFTKDDAEKRMAFMKPYLSSVAVVILTPEHIGGKEGRLLTMQRKS